MRRIVVFGVLLAVACGWCAAFASAAMAETETQEKERGRELGIKAYIYGQPLLDTERIFKTSTSVTVATEDGYAPVNQFSHFKHLTTNNESVVVAPNDDTLYAVAWLKLKAQPMVLHVPEARAASTSSRWFRRGPKTSPTSAPRHRASIRPATTSWSRPAPMKAWKKSTA